MSLKFLKENKLDYFKNFLDNLHAAEKNIWNLLVQGAINKKSNFHHPTISTINGTNIGSRTLILRKASIEKKTLFFYTDFRSKKVNAIKYNKNVII